MKNSFHTFWHERTTLLNGDDSKFYFIFYQLPVPTLSVVMIVMMIVMVETSLVFDTTRIVLYIVQQRHGLSTSHSNIAFLMSQELN